jgi:drug/metabolite transporter, DME family
MAMKPATARASLLFTALLFSTGGAAIKAVSLTNWQVACLRSIIAAVLLWLWTGRKLYLSKGVVLAGLAQAATLVTFVTANKMTTAANAVFFQGTAPLYIAIIGPYWLGERLPRRDYPVLLAIAAGIGLLFFGPADAVATAPNRLLGNIIGACSGLCWSLTVMGLRNVARHDSGHTSAAAGSATIVGNAAACLVCAPLAFPMAMPAPNDMAVLLYLGVFQVALAYFLLSRSLSHVPAVDASLLLLAEPAFSPVWAWLVHGETPGLWPFLGGLLIVGSTTWKTLRDSRRLRGTPAAV